MRRFQHILYVTRGTEDETDSLKQALSLARNNATALHALVISPMLPKHLSEYQAGYEMSVVDRCNVSITNARASLKMTPDEVHCDVQVECSDSPAVSIVRRVLRDALDLVIKQVEPTDRREGFQALDMQLLRLCPCPVWLCRPVTRSRNDIRVAVAVDPQSMEPARRDLALELLRLARSLADTCGGELTVVSCWDFEFESSLRHSPWIKSSDEAIVEDVDTAERNGQAALEALIRESGIAGPVRVHHVRGQADRAIPEVVDDLKIDILVMGTVGRTGIPGFVIGNTAENVLRELKCSLLALKPNGFVSPVRAY